jgi:SAM-dependent methyltransferase
MIIVNKIINKLKDSRVKSMDIDSSDVVVAHRKILKDKKILQELFYSFYNNCRKFDEKFFDSCDGKRLEIGSGSSIIKDVFPDIITSDIKKLPFVDVVCRAEEMPFHDNELRAIYAINVFHHIPNPRAFFREALRVLQPGGGIILIEPWYGPIARRLFSNLHETEGFYPDAPNWEANHQTGPMSNANQALSYIVFNRDREKFVEEFPELEIVVTKPHTHLWYVLSGGVNFKQLVPDVFIPVVKFFERVLSPLNKWISLQHTIVLRKKSYTNNSLSNPPYR